MFECIIYEMIACCWQICFMEIASCKYVTVGIVWNQCMIPPILNKPHIVVIVIQHSISNLNSYKMLVKRLEDMIWLFQDNKFDHTIDGSWITSHAKQAFERGQTKVKKYNAWKHLKEAAYEVWPYGFDVLRSPGKVCNIWVKGNG